jgi:FkbH-like protein
MPAARAAISSFFTAEPLQEPLEFLFDLLGWQGTVEFAPFAQVFQTLLDPQSVFARTPDAAHIVLARASDIQDSLDSFADALLGSTGNLLVQICAPHSEAVELALRARLSLETRVSVLSGNQLDRHYAVAEPLDPRAHELGGIPYTAEYYAALASHLARAMHRSSCKVIALDCDDTLWRGVCGEDGPQGIVLDASRRQLQQFMKEQRSSGRLLAIASKNNEADVLETFRQHPEFPLHLGDFASRQIHWEPKSRSLESIAADLNLGLDSFVFLDNDAKEVGEVAAELPSVVAVALPADDVLIPAFLDHVWAFDTAQALTAEDLARAESYASEARRTGEARQARSLDEFLAGLELKITITPIEQAHVARIAQLTQRTNQMNTTTRRRSEADIRAFLEKGFGLAVKVRDRLGDYGLVGAMLLTESGPELVVDSFMLSCRALGRGVEHRMLRRIGEVALEHGLASVHVEFESTAKNVPAHDFLMAAADGEGPFVFPADELSRLEYKPSAMRPHAIAAPRGQSTQRPPNYQRIAELRRPADLLAAVNARKAGRDYRRASYQAPRTDLERRLSSLWTELLGVTHIGANDNFFDLGGHSLLAVQLVSRLNKELAIELPLEAVYTGALTVAELARSIELFELGQVDDSEYAALLAEVESLSEEEAEALLASESDAEKSELS